MIKVSNLSFSYNKINVIEDISFDVKKGEFVGIIGQNGSGKSTVLKNIYRGLTPKSGAVLLENENLVNMSFKQSAKKMAVVGQENELHFDFSVEEIVAMGRNPHKNIFDIDDENDKKIVLNSLKSLGIEELGKRRFLNLSGGEKQRVIIARAIAQESKFLILDEPTNYLDIKFQIQIFEMIKSLNVTVLSAIHDLNLASHFCDRLIVLKDGKLILEGTPEEVLTSENIYDIYGVDSYIEKNKVTGKNTVVFLPSIM